MPSSTERGRALSSARTWRRTGLLLREPDEVGLGEHHGPVAAGTAQAQGPGHRRDVEAVDLRQGLEGAARRERPVDDVAVEIGGGLHGDRRRRSRNRRGSAGPAGRGRSPRSGPVIQWPTRQLAGVGPDAPHRREGRERPRVPGPDEDPVRDRPSGRHRPARPGCRPSRKPGRRRVEPGERRPRARGAGSARRAGRGIPAGRRSRRISGRGRRWGRSCPCPPPARRPR